MKACATLYVLTYATALKLQLVSWKVEGMTAAKFKTLVLSMHVFSLSSTTYLVHLDLHGLSYWPSLCSFGTDLREHIRFQQFLNFCSLICCSWKVFTEPLPINCRLLFLNCSAFQPSCHIAPSLTLLAPVPHRRIVISSSARGRASDMIVLTYKKRTDKIWHTFYMIFNATAHRDGKSSIACISLCSMRHITS
jgi:hypothetical protein